jgi:hypothetical protein
MKIDLEKFRRNKPEIINIYKTYGRDRFMESCVISGISLLNALAYAIEEGLDKKQNIILLEDLRKFYGIEDIVGWQKNV